ncbi:MAG: DNA-binding protein [Flavobacteriales bacterium]|nr:DNA-binding protein [Flavobacteriales bacterium]
MLDRYEASAFTGFKPGTLAVWDSTKAYDLEPIKFGNAVRYRLSSLNRFADERIRPSRR